MEIPSLKMQKLSQPVRILWLHKWRVNWFQRCQFRRVCIYYFKNKSFMQALCHSIFPHLKATVEPGSSGAVHERYGLEILINKPHFHFESWRGETTTIFELREWTRCSNLIHALVSSLSKQRHLATRWELSACGQNFKLVRTTCVPFSLESWIEFSKSCPSESQMTNSSNSSAVYSAWARGFQ